MILSVLIHLCLILLAIKLTAVVVMNKKSPLGDAILMALGGGGGGGGQGGPAFNAPKPPPPPEATPPILPPPPPTVIPPPPPVVTPPVQSAPVSDAPPVASAVVATGTGGGTGGGAGSGEGPGRGSGIGPGSGAGTGGGTGGGSSGYPPEPKQLILPPLDAPKSLRGKTVDVTMWISADGHVTDITVTPPVTDKSYANKFDNAMRGYRFHPAKDPLGNAVAGVIKVQVTF